ncbi:MAG: uroporphyrinogen decarboxylase [Pseudomonadota bacterium]
MDKPLLNALKGHAQPVSPIWMMRQAGRYLPEYRAVRATTPSFLEFCYSPEKAAEVTLQPIDRFDFDAAILFSDILVVPDALGQEVWFEEGFGPRLTPIDPNAPGLDGPEKAIERLEPVFEAVERIRDRLNPEKALLGFCGAPWTLATYMIAGRGKEEQRAAREAILRKPAACAALFDLLVDTSIVYLCEQIRRGVDAVQIFDTWAGALDDLAFDTWVTQPTRRIVAGVKARHPDVPVVGFPKGVGLRLERYVMETGIDAVGLDSGVPLDFARDVLQKKVCVQGNIDPLRLIMGGEALSEAIEAALSALGSGPYVFNLGHGVSPDTPIDHVQAMVDQVRAYRSG